MGKLRTIEQQLEAHRKWLEQREKRKAREEEWARKRAEKEKLKEAKRKEREAKRQQMLLQTRQKEEQRREEQEANRQQRENRTIPIYHRKWMVRERYDEELYTKYELEHIEELYPEEQGRINFDVFWRLVNEFKEKYERERNKEQKVHSERN